jgi:Protein of unknown function (DUF4058)
MQNPFPGMNPYLEQSELWHQVHNRLIVAIADDLTPQIASQYRVSIEERIYTSVDDALLVGVADVAVTNRGSSMTLVTEKATEPRTVKLLMPEQVVERYLEIRPASSSRIESPQFQEVISVIEILSPKNKRTGEGRTAYTNKRQKILSSLTSLIEIDLLRSGQSMPLLGETDPGYRILISRSHRRPDADLYSFTLRDRIPSFPIPLRQGEPEPVIDLQKLLNEVYQRARFDLAIDYSQLVKPSLSANDTEWMTQILSTVS